MLAAKQGASMPPWLRGSVGVGKKRSARGKHLTAQARASAKATEGADGGDTANDADIECELGVPSLQGSLGDVLMSDCVASGLGARGAGAGGTCESPRTEGAPPGRRGSNASDCGRSARNASDHADSDSVFGAAPSEDFPMSPPREGSDSDSVFGVAPSDMVDLSPPQSPLCPRSWAPPACPAAYSGVLSPVRPPKGPTPGMALPLLALTAPGSLLA